MTLDFRTLMRGTSKTVSGKQIGRSEDVHEALLHSGGSQRPNLGGGIPQAIFISYFQELTLDSF